MDNILLQLGTVDLAFITGDYALGIDSGIIDLIIVGKIGNHELLQHLTEKVEEVIKRKIRVLVLSKEELSRLKEKLKVDKALLVWNNS